jgi:hypothetical protein
MGTIVNTHKSLKARTQAPPLSAARQVFLGD